MRFPSHGHQTPYTPSFPLRVGWCVESGFCLLDSVTVVLAWGKRPVPFRTRKLSPTAPMVLPWRRGGRVGRRRTTIPSKGVEQHESFGVVLAPPPSCISGQCFSRDLTANARLSGQSRAPAEQSADQHSCGWVLRPTALWAKLPEIHRPRLSWPCERRHIPHRRGLDQQPALEHE